ncbi:hypothetical protein D3C83_17300 [compost metagenome]
MTDAADVDDTAPAALQHVRHRRAGAEERAVEHDADDVTPLFGRHFLERHHAAVGGIVDQDIDPAEALPGLAEHPRDRGLVGDVGEAHLRLPAHRLDFGPDLLGFVARAARVDHDRGPFARQRVRNGAPAAAHGAGDQRDLTLELPRHGRPAPTRP